MSNQESARVIVNREKCYKVILSTKTEVKCDKNEIQRVIEGIGTGGIIKLKQGLINPSFIVAVVEDEERRIEFSEKVYSVDRSNRQDLEYHGGKNQRELPQGLTPLKDIFAGTQLKALGNGSEIKRLNEGQ